MKNTYFVLRHGKSLANLQELIISNPADAIRGYGLTIEGRKQVYDSVMEARAKGTLDASTIIFSSDFLRTEETARIASEILGVYDITFTPRLRERFFGEWEKTATSNYQKVWDDDIRDHFHKIKKVESVAEVVERIRILIEEIEKDFSLKNILLVSHGDVLQILETYVSLQHPSQHRSLAPLATGSLRKLGRLQ